MKKIVNSGFIVGIIGYILLHWLFNVSTLGSLGIILTLFVVYLLWTYLENKC